MLFVVAIVIASALGVLLFRAVALIRTIDAHPWLGPIDWWFVLGNREMLGLAWDLANDSKLRHDFVLGSRVVRNVVPIGSDSASFESSVCLGSSSHFTLFVRNMGKNALLIPPIHDLQIKRIEMGDAAFVLVYGKATRGWLSDGAQYVQPDATATIQIPSLPLEGFDGVRIQFIVTGGHSNLSMRTIELTAGRSLIGEQALSDAVANLNSGEAIKLKISRITPTIGTDSTSSPKPRRPGVRSQP